jgi:hypothetical protein
VRINSLSDELIRKKKENTNASIQKIIVLGYGSFYISTNTDGTRRT